jgi:hypothetical protein
MLLAIVRVKRGGEQVARLNLREAAVGYGVFLTKADEAEHDIFRLEVESFKCFSLPVSILAAISFLKRWRVGREALVERPKLMRMDEKC